MSNNSITAQFHFFPKENGGKKEKKTVKRSVITSGKSANSSSISINVRG